MVLEWNPVSGESKSAKGFDINEILNEIQQIVDRSDRPKRLINLLPIAVIARRWCLDQMKTQRERDSKLLKNVTPRPFFSELYRFTELSIIDLSKTATYIKVHRVVYQLKDLVLEIGFPLVHKVQLTEVSMAVQRLPNDILMKIFDYLDTADKLMLTNCCSTFASVMPFHEIDVDVVANITPVSRDETDAIPFVYGLFEEERLRDILSKASTYVSLANCRIVRLQPGSSFLQQDGGLVLSEAFPKLKHLIVNGSVRLEHLCYFVNLGTLIADELIVRGDCDKRHLAVLCRLHLFRVSDLSLAELRAGVGDTVIPGMRRLRTSRTTKFDSVDVAFISKVLPNIKEVTLCNLQGKIWIEWFAMCPRLEILRMVHSRVTLIKSPMVPPLGLRTLCLADECKVVDFSFLRQLHCLTELVIWCDNFSYRDLQQLPSSASLTYLDVSYTKAISDELLGILLNRRYPLKFLIANVDPQQFERQILHLDDWDLSYVNTVTWFSTRALALYLESSPGLEVLSVNDQRSINDSLFAKDCDSFKTLHSLRLDTTGCSNFSITQLCHHRKTAIEGGDILPTMALAASSNLRGFSKMLQESFIVLDDSMWVSRAELEMMSFLATNDSERVRLKRKWEWIVSSESDHESDDSTSSDSSW